MITYLTKNLKYHSKNANQSNQDQMLKESSMITPLNYRDKVLQHLIDLKDGEVFTIKTDNRSYKSYILAVKTIIDCGHEIANGFTLTFNEDYTRLTKHSLATSEKEVNQVTWKTAIMKKREL